MSDELNDRIRRVLGDHPDLAEIRMMGGLCFTLAGNMVVGTMKGGDLLVRVGEARHEEAMAKPGAGPMAFTGRSMKGFVLVDAAAVEDDAALRDWISLASAYVGTLPPKEKKPKTKRGRKTA